MLRSPIFVSLVILAFCATFLFILKHNVQSLSKQLKSVNSQILKEKENIHVLQAEYSYLSSPKRIKKLVDKHLHLQSPKREQIIDMEHLNKLQAKAPETNKIDGGQ
jgi:cell division protein FtsL